MKNILGRFLLFFIFYITVFADGKLATYSLKANKTKIHIKEPLVLVFKAKQTDTTDNMFFTLEPIKSKDYEIHFLYKDLEENGYHNNRTKFVYVLFAKSAKTISVGFNWTIKTASDRAVRQSVVDDHDDSIATKTYDTHVRVEPLKIEVLPLKHDVSLVGDFTISSKIDKSSMNQYDSVNLHYTLSGTGYKENNLTLLKKIPNVTMFLEVNDIQSKLTAGGYNVQREFVYALTSDKNFTIPKISIKAYSPIKDRYYTINAKSYKIDVKSYKFDDLIDKENYPIEKDFIDISYIKEFLKYLIIFALGFLSAKLLPKKRAKQERFEDIKNTKNAKELIIVLINRYHNRGIESFVNRLEAIEQEKATLEFKKIKREILRAYEKS